MELLMERDRELIAKARKVIRLNYDQEHYNHTVGAAVRCKNGKIYVGSQSLFFTWDLRGASGNRNSDHKRREGF